MAESPATIATPAPDQAAPDQAARDRVTRDLDTTLFVEAGAGSGKTTALVDRVVSLVTTGTAELRSIAAITFTEKAAAELRDRVRRVLQVAVANTRTSAEERDRCRLALDQLDGAAIGTLHGFAQRILSEHAIEAGIPPRIEVLDEVTSGVDFERRWSAFRDELLADPAMERTLMLLMACGVTPTALRALAATFDDNWDLVAERVPATAPEAPDAIALLDGALFQIEAVCAMRDQCRDDDDKLRVRLEAIADYARELRAVGDEYDLLEALGSNASPTSPSFKVGNIGKSAAWPGTTKEEIRERLPDAGGALRGVRDVVARGCAERIGVAIRRFTLRAADERRASGRLEFHDLLVLARSLLRDPTHGAAVRRRLHDRYQRLLLDEFQDTDPIQIELAVRIAAADPGSAAAGEHPWTDVDVSPGHLFVVGDPKQSIYRFRRADISMFLMARNRFSGGAGGSTGGSGMVELSANFRTAEAIVGWVNHVFASLMAEPADVEVPVPSQPAYVRLDPVRGAPPVGPPVSVVGHTAHAPDTPADEIRAIEAADVVAIIEQALAEGWSVDDGNGGWRPAAPGDITVLVPARTSLPFLEDALDDKAIPYRAESTSLVYATRAIRDLLMLLRAVDDPTNEMRVVAALRSPLLGCGDDDLFRFKVESRGRWNYLKSQPDTVAAGDPVATGMSYLRRLHRERQWRSPSELLDLIARDRRAFELGFADGRARDVWRRIRFIVDQARAWSTATGGGLRQYLQWVDLQTAEGARVAEAVLPETDDDAVRIMTIHAAKGLEFPITVVSGMSTGPNHQRAAAEAVFPPVGGNVGYRFGASVMTEDFENWKPIDEQMGYDERIRLLYVACTRVRDHLVVSVHRKSRKSVAKPSNRTNAELLFDGMGELEHSLPTVDEEARADRPRIAPPPLARLLDFAEWEAQRQRALARATRPSAVAATALTAGGKPDHEPEPDDATEVEAGLQKRPRDLDLPPWLKGRYGTAVGRAVHGVLQTVDLATGHGLDGAAAAQCMAEAIPDRLDVVVRLARQALDSPSVLEAAQRPHWREVYASTPVAGRLLEGYVDLLYRDAEGLVVIDHKTSASADPADLDSRVAGYRLQGAAYAVAVGAATGEPVVRVTFVFLTPAGPIERHLDDLEAAKADVLELVAKGAEVLTS